MLGLCYTLSLSLSIFDDAGAACYTLSLSLSVFDDTGAAPAE